MTDIFEREVEYKFFREKFPELLHGKFGSSISSALRYGVTTHQRETLLMYYVDGLRAVDIAKKRGVYPSTVTRTLKRAKKNLYYAARYMGAL